MTKNNPKATNKLRSLMTVTGVLMVITAGVHSISLFVKPEPVTETEQQLLHLTTTYRIDAGGGYHPTYQNLFTALSTCFSLLYLFGGLILVYLRKRFFDRDLLGGLLNIFIVIFWTAFAVMTALTFLPPIICTGIVAASLGLTRMVHWLGGGRS